MRSSVLTGFFAWVILIAAGSGSVSAAPTDLQLTEEALEVHSASTLEFDLDKKETDSRPPASPRIYEVQTGDNLTKIAERHTTTWKRLYDKNVHIAHPDIIKAGEKLTIPETDEQLTERPVPAGTLLTSERAEPAPPRAAKKNRPAAGSYRGSSAGNTYTPGYCTWYAKNMRPDLPNNLGNANTWVSRAAAQGLPTGSVPKAGAIGQQGMHVVYVQTVNPDGTVTVSEMNYQGRFVVSSRTVPASTFHYIY